MYFYNLGTIQQAMGNMFHCGASTSLELQFSGCPNTQNLLSHQSTGTGANIIAATTSLLADKTSRGR